MFWSLFEPTAPAERTSSRAKLGAKTNGGRTALHFAADGGHVEACALLLDRGAELGAKGNSGRTALDFAAAGGHEEVCKLLRGPRRGAGRSPAGPR